MRYPTLFATGVVPLAVLALAACSSSSSSRSATAPGSTTPSSASTRSSSVPYGTPSASSSDLGASATAYSKCMRTHGVPTFPQAIDGHIYLQARPGSVLDPTSPTFKAAAATCAKLVPDFHPKGTTQVGPPH